MEINFDKTKTAEKNAIARQFLSSLDTMSCTNKPQATSDSCQMCGVRVGVALKKRGKITASPWFLRCAVQNTHLNNKKHETACPNVYHLHEFFLLASHCVNLFFSLCSGVLFFLVR